MTGLKPRIFMLVTLLLALVPAVVLADNPQSIPPFVVAIPPFGEMEVAVRGHCLDYGLPFPGAALSLVGVADAEVRSAILYSLEKGYYDEENLEKVQNAIWAFTDNLDISSDENVVAQEVATYARDASPGDMDADVTSLVDAVGKGWIKVTISDFVNVSDPPFFGQGTLVIANRTDATVNVNIPYGVVFEDKTQDGVQDMAIFPADLPAADPETANEVGGESVCRPLVVRLPANETANILINGYCMDYGLPFPGTSIRPVELAPNVVRNTICYNIAKAYVQEDLWQAQLAIWRQTDALDKGTEFNLANETAAYSESDVDPGDIVDGCTELTKAVGAGTVSATIDDFENISDPEYFGKGTLVMTNLTDSEQRICIPYGVRFTDETRDGVQDMAIYPSQNPDPDDLEEPEVLPETGGALAGSELLAIALLVIGLSLAGSGYFLRRLSHARSRLT